MAADHLSLATQPIRFLGSNIPSLSALLITSLASDTKMAVWLLNTGIVKRNGSEIGLAWRTEGTLTS